MQYACDEQRRASETGGGDWILRKADHAVVIDDERGQHLAGQGERDQRRGPELGPSTVVAAT